MACINNLIQVYYQNVRGLRSKTTQFRLGILECNWDIVAITETWLNDSIFSAELFPDQYQVYRRDRCQLRTGMSRGGGVLVGVASHIKSRRLHFLETEGENIWLKLEFPNNISLIVPVAYFKPNSSLNHYINYFEKIDLYN